MRIWKSKNANNFVKEIFITLGLGGTGEAERKAAEAKAKDTLREEAQKVKNQEGELPLQNWFTCKLEQLKGFITAQTPSLGSIADRFETIAEGFGKEVKYLRGEFFAFKGYLFKSKNKLSRSPMTPDTLKSSSILFTLFALDILTLSAFFLGQGSVPNLGTAITLGASISLINVILACFGIGYLGIRYCHHPESQIIRITAIFGVGVGIALLAMFHLASAYIRVKGLDANLLNLFSDLPKIFESYTAISILLIGALISIFSMREGVFGFSDPYPDYIERFKAIRKPLEGLEEERKLALEDIDDLEDELQDELEEFQEEIKDAQNDKKSLWQKILHARDEFQRAWEGEKGILENGNAAWRELHKQVTGKPLKTAPIDLDGEKIHELPEVQNDDWHDLYHQTGELSEQIAQSANDARQRIKTTYSQALKAIYGKLEKGDQNEKTPE